MSLLTLPTTSSTLVDYTLGRTIDINGSSKVKIGTDPQGAEVAIKIYDLSNRYEVERTMLQYIDETEALPQMNHRNVVKFLTSTEQSLMHHGDTQKHVAYVVSEKIVGHELMEFLD